MVADNMASPDNLTDKIRMGLGLRPDDEEYGPMAMTLEHIENPRRHIGVRAVIKCQEDALLIVQTERQQGPVLRQTANGADKDSTPYARGAIGENTNSASDGRTDKNDKQRTMHSNILDG